MLVRLDRAWEPTVQMSGNRAHRRIWNILMTDENPHGLTTFADCQVRYLVRSEADWFGAVGFSASAFHLGARDRWTAQPSEAKHNRVVCMSRFLIRPAVRCANLASRVLGMVLRRVGRALSG